MATSLAPTRFDLLRRAMAALLVCLLGTQSGCASLPAPIEQPTSRALADPSGTPLGQSLLRQAPAGAHSGFANLIAGEDALAARLALADQARRTLDLQYYAIHDDASAMRVIEHVRAAARRGVRVRVLVDDMNTTGTDGALRALMDEPGIEVRLYNPFPAGRFSTITRILASLADFSRINRRMHNKLFVADNAVAITGGRNLGDEYFVHSGESNFVDLDLMIGGAAVRPLSASFDSFWNHKLAYPASLFVAPAPVPAAASASAPPDVSAAAPAASAPATPSTVETQHTQPNRLAGEIAAGRWPLVWAPARVFVDSPSKIEGDGDPAPDETLADDMDKLLHSARSEVILISPYFVPGERSMGILRELRARGVTVRVLTNSLASTDAPAVHIGYARYRTDLLRIGISLHELRTRSDDVSIQIGSFRSASSKLHAKAIIVDRTVSLVGSMNFDPRSERLNSETGLLVRSAALAQEVVALYESITRDACYRLWLDEYGRLRWTSPGRTPEGETLESEPGASLWLRFLVKALAPLAPQEWL